jgi:hypothetical protein
MSDKPKITLLIGSAPDAVRAGKWDSQVFDNIVAINNAWKVRDDWDYLIHPEDFPITHTPQRVGSNQSIITASEYVPVQNSFGGFVYAGGTMAFTAAYWALGALQPDILAFVGCDMVYPSDGTSTHFYGFGSADPLRKDITLQSLEAKSTRLLYMAAQNTCLCLNLSDMPDSRLIFPRAETDALHHATLQSVSKSLDNINVAFNQTLVGEAKRREQELAYHFASGRYWEHLDAISPEQLQVLDGIWKNAGCSLPTM